MTDAERQELYTLMQQWGRNDDILYQKIREWVEAKIGTLQLERDALREALRGALECGRFDARMDPWIDRWYKLLSLPASGEPARKP